MRMAVSPLSFSPLILFTMHSHCLLCACTVLKIYVLKTRVRSMSPFNCWSHVNSLELKQDNGSTRLGGGTEKWRLKMAIHLWEIYIDTHILFFIYIYAHTHVSVYIFIYIHIYVYLYTHMYICVYKCMFICVYLYMHKYIHVYKCVYTHIYTRIYIILLKVAIFPNI